MTKIQSTSMFMIQAIRSLLVKSHEEKELLKDKNADVIRKLIQNVKQNDAAYRTFTDAVNQKFPNLISYIILAVKQFTQMGIPVTKTRSMDDDFVSQAVFSHFLKVCFVHPRIFSNVQNQQKYTLYTCLKLFDDEWTKFILLQVALEVDTESLTLDRLEFHEKEFSETKSTPRILPQTRPITIPKQNL